MPKQAGRAGHSEVSARAIAVRLTDSAPHGIREVTKDPQSHASMTNFLGRGMGLTGWMNYAERVDTMGEPHQETLRQHDA